MRKAIVLSLGVALIVGLFSSGALAHHGQTASAPKPATSVSPRPRIATEYASFSFEALPTEERSTSASRRRPIRTCVKDRFRDGNDDSVFVTRLRWSTNFPNEGPGAYTVDWRQNGSRTGKRLGFHQN